MGNANISGTDVLIVAQAVFDLSTSVYYLTIAVSTLAIVGLLGYWVALRTARDRGR